MPKDDKRPPAFLLYVNDFCSDGIVEAMTTEEVGAYFLILCKAWLEDQAGTVPDDDRVLARWARLTPQRWSKCKAHVMAAFRQLSDGRWHQSRMKKEYAKWQIAQREKSERGAKAAQARWGDADALQTHSPSNAKTMLKNAISSSLSLSNSISSDGDGDGARFSCFSEDARVRARRIAGYVRPSKPEDVELTVKVAILVESGKIAENDLEQVLESYAAAEEPIRNRAAWFQECLANRVENFYQLLLLTDVPAEYSRNGSPT